MGTEQQSILQDPHFLQAVEQYNRYILPQSFSQVHWSRRVLVETLALPFLQNFLVTCSRTLISAWKVRGGLVGLVRQAFRTTHKPPTLHSKLSNVTIEFYT
ncbi:hypothetical protein BB561_001168 [Smittium simulii]|uniref:Uncharacterized protein n=1 Tax=Smittium simulii TaxID=133385 RepID=A0A2T9YVR4_9FUNG|nr:hypothetical protein BB561_001168 [Smittium simulii]